jgi:hypothetical protein
LELARLPYHENVVNQTGYDQAQRQENRYQEVEPWDFWHPNKSCDPVGLGLCAPSFGRKELNGANQYFLRRQASRSCDYNVCHLILLASVSVRVKFRVSLLRAGRT